MKAINNTLLALALSLSPSLALFAQDQLPTSPALDRALLVEEIEHDLEEARKLYAELAADAQASDELRRHAALRLGRLQAKLGDHEAARTALEHAAEGVDEVARLAREGLVDPSNDEQRERLLREEARRLIADIPDQTLAQFLSGDAGTRRLIWIGRAAAPELIRAIEARRDGLPQEKEIVVSLAALLWRSGGPEAAAYLDALREDPNLALRRLVARALFGNNAREDQMVAIAQRYLADPDPEGFVVCSVLGSTENKLRTTWRRFDVSAIIALVDSEVPNVREQALLLLGGGWNELRHEGDEAATMKRLIPGLERALDDLDPDVVQAAHEALQKLGLKSSSSRALLVKRLPTLGPDFTLDRTRALPVSSQEANSAALLPMLRALGPASSPTPSHRDESARVLITMVIPKLRRSSLETVLEAMRLGYAWSTDASKWIERVCDSRDAERLLEAMLEMPKLERLYPWLSELELSPQCWPGLAELAKRMESQEPEHDWTRYDSQHASLLVALGRTATPGAVAHLKAQLLSPIEAHHYEALVNALLYASIQRPEADVVTALREALVLEVTGRTRRSRQFASPKLARQAIFARLVELGDPRAFELLPKAFELGLDIYRLSSESIATDRFDGSSGREMGWLTLRHQADGELIYFHGYDEATLASIWDALLARPLGEPWNQSWDLLYKALKADLGATERWRGMDVPVRYLGTSPSLVEVAARHWTMRVAAMEEPFFKGERGLTLLLDIRRRKILTNAPALEALDQLHAACLTSSNHGIRRLALNMLPEPLDESSKASLQLALSDSIRSNAIEAASRLIEAEQVVSRELLLRMLNSPTPGARSWAIRNYVQLVEGGAIDLVKAKLTDEASTVRSTVCWFLGTQLDTNAVPELLKALADPANDVRTAAADALSAIRYYHDEKAYWDRVFAGTELSADSAAGALLEQASEQNSLEVRLLALRSLGVLGVPETLPFLIELTSSANEQIASTARAAIERIHKEGAK